MVIIDFAIKLTIESLIFICGEYVIKKHCLRGLLPIPMHTKISGEYITIK